MLLQSIYRKSKCLLQPHRSTCPNGRIQPSASKVCPLQYPPFLCCCKPFHKKDLSALLAGFFQQYAGFSICPYTTPKPVCANAALPPKGQSSISKCAHTVKNYLHCTGKLFFTPCLSQPHRSTCLYGKIQARASKSHAPSPPQAYGIFVCASPSSRSDARATA